MSEFTAPIRPRLTLRVGVSGHRRLTSEEAQALRRLTSAVLRSVLEIADEVRLQPNGGYSGDPACVRVLSQLAVGSDTVVTEAAEEFRSRGLGDVEIQVVLPYAEADYLRDFHVLEKRAEPDPGAVAKFQELLHKASRVFSLPAITPESLPGWAEADAKGREDLLSEARLARYEAAGRVVLQQCDLMIIVLERYSAGSRGGTAQMASEAQAAEIPCIWFDPKKPNRARLRYAAASGRGDKLLRIPETDDAIIPYAPVKQTIKELVSLPRTSGHAGDGAAAYAQFLTEGRPGRFSRVIYRLPWEVLRVLSFPFRLDLWRQASRAVRARFQQLPQDAPPPPAPAIPPGADERALYEQSYQHAGNLALHYAVLYRGSFLWNYTFGAAAITTALLAYADRSRELLWSIIELGLLLLLCTNLLWARLNQWQRRSVDYRFLSEQFRHLRFLHLVGLTTPNIRHPVYRLSGDPRQSWFNWYVEGIARMVGLPQGEATPTYLSEVRRVYLQRWIAGQEKYHASNHHRLHASVFLLGSVMAISFFAALMACLAHVVIDLAALEQVRSWMPNVAHFLEPYHALLPWLTVIAAAAPAWGGACHAIEVQGEFERLVVRSHEMQASLRELHTKLNELGDAPEFADLFACGRKTGEVMIADIVDWRILYKLRAPQPI